MFKFPNSNRVHFQCDILVCKGEQNQGFFMNRKQIFPLPVGPCKSISCEESVPEARSLDDPSEARSDALLAPPEDGALVRKQGFQSIILFLLLAFNFRAYFRAFGLGPGPEFSPNSGLRRESSEKEYKTRLNQLNIL